MRNEKKKALGKSKQITTTATKLAPPADRAIPHKDRIVLNDVNAGSNTLPDELANLELEVVVDGKATKFKQQGKVTPLVRELSHDRRE